MSTLDELVNLKSLEMAKKRDKKVYITDIAINKVPLNKIAARWPAEAVAQFYFITK